MADVCRHGRPLSVTCDFCRVERKDRDGDLARRESLPGRRPVIPAPFKCDDCGYTTAWRDTYIRHREQHTEAGEFADALDAAYRSGAATELLRPQPHSVRQRQTPTPVSTPGNRLAEWRAYFLNLINHSRQAAGLANVTLGNNEAAQGHAEAMLEYGFVGHWGLDGLTPVMRYTLAGGSDYASENVRGVSGIRNKDWGPRHRPKGWKSLLNEAHQGLMNSPDHRKNILDRWHKKVNLGIACNRYTCSVAQQFEYDYVDFTKLPSLSGKGDLNLEGKLKGGFTLSGLQVWYHQPPHALTLRQLDGTYSYGLGQEPATFIIRPAPRRTRYPASALEPRSYSWSSGIDPYSVSPQAPRNMRSSKGKQRKVPQVETRRKAVPRTVAFKWSEKRGRFQIKANIRKSVKDLGLGVYIIVIWGENGGIEVPLTNYAIFVD